MQTAPGMLSASLLRCSDHQRCIPGVSSRWSLSSSRYPVMVLSRVIGCSIASCQRPSGGTILSSPEAGCSSSGRKNASASGAPVKAIRCGLWSAWTNSGGLPENGTRRASSPSPADRSPPRCARSSSAWAWSESSGTHSSGGARIHLRRGRRTSGSRKPPRRWGQAAHWRSSATWYSEGARSPRSSPNRIALAPSRGAATLGPRPTRWTTTKIFFAPNPTTGCSATISESPCSTPWATRSGATG